MVSPAAVDNRSDLIQPRPGVFPKPNFQGTWMASQGHSAQVPGQMLPLSLGLKRPRSFCPLSWTLPTALWTSLALCRPEDETTWRAHCRHLVQPGRPTPAHVRHLSQDWRANPRPLLIREARIIPAETRTTQLVARLVSNRRLLLF